jgi:hypothetical protein
MRRPSLLLAFVPYLYLLIAALIYHAVWLQPTLTSRRNPPDYLRVIDESGGRHAVQIGFALDLVFVMAFGIGGVVALVRVGDLWPLPIVAAVLDGIEDSMALRLIATEPTSGALQLLLTVAVAKYVAYIASAIAIVHGAKTGSARLFSRKRQAASRDSSA